MNFKPRRTDEPELNMTPLIDVVLLLVVFFMLSSTFVQEGRLRVRLPEARDVPVTRPAQEPIVVSVTEGGGYRVNERDLVNAGADTLRAALLAVAGEERGIPVTLRADARASHQAVVTAMDVLGKLGFAEINIATVNDADAAGP
ncbi:MAG TPA: biopolymer transporter ExbD [Steroidobacteraceae bacterium]|nr:biopolymer transporter ExbD [Steroidobacteraceae bacterium]HNS27535.1 biopolymer transporter ExbD [Steroidobacteraceae bacterium]